MKYLILVRHAKSCWENNEIDHKRPINKRGKNDAELVSKFLEKTLDVVPDLIVISDAKRAQLTAEIFIKNLKWQNVETQLNHDLYDFSGESAFNVITSCPIEVNNLVIFGHNPTFTLLASQLGSEFIDNIPTTGVVIIAFDVDSWENIKSGETIKTIYPRDLK